MRLRFARFAHAVLSALCWMMMRNAESRLLMMSRLPKTVCLFKNRTRSVPSASPEEREGLDEIDTSVFFVGVTRKLQNNDMVMQWLHTSKVEPEPVQCVELSDDDATARPDAEKVTKGANASPQDINSSSRHPG